MTSRRKTALVTGGRRGIGRGIALSLAEAGFDILILDLEHDESAEQTLTMLRELGGKAYFMAGDLADVSSHAALADTVFATLGTLDCLVNNAGISVRQRGDLLEVSPESFDTVLGVNLRGTFFLTQAIANRMAKEVRDVNSPARTIINVSSFNATGISIDRGEYCISKAGIATLSKLFAVRLAPLGIGVFEVRPGIIHSDMTTVAQEKYDRLIADGLTPIARWGEASDVGRAVVGLASGLFGFSLGDVIHVDGGLHIPRL